MSPHPFFGFVSDVGKLTLDFPAQFRAFLQRFHGEEIELEIRKRRTKRSLKQNAYYWSVVVPVIARELGYSDEEFHEAMKAKFLNQEDLEHGLWRIGSTTKLTTTEFGDYTDRIVLWAAEKLGCIVPQPEKAEKHKGKAA